MKIIDLHEWLELLKSQEDDHQKIKAIENARVLIETGLEKLSHAGLPAPDKLFLYTNMIMGGITLEQTHQGLSNSEATRLLMIVDYYEREHAAPQVIQLTDYKSNNPNRDDVANEGRILNQLEDKSIIQRERVDGQRMELEHIQLTDTGKAMAQSMILDNSFLRKIYNRSRNKKIREFLVKYIEQSQRGV